MLSASINWTLLGAAAVALLGIRGALGGFNNTMWELTELERDRRPAGRVASIEALVSGVIHEITNPLGGIKTGVSDHVLAHGRG